MGKLIIGIDEVGRGALAGPLVVAAVGLKQPIPGLADSKVLSKSMRQKLNKEIKQSAVYLAYGQSSPEEIDQLGLSRAIGLAMRRSLGALEQEVDIIIDGNVDYLKPDYRAEAIVKADSLIPAVMAAGVAAKVERDRQMHALGQLYKAYGFEQHVGYGTAAHLDALRRYGPCIIHRRSFAPVRALV